MTWVGPGVELGREGGDSLIKGTSNVISHHPEREVKKQIMISGNISFLEGFDNQARSC